MTTFAYGDRSAAPVARVVARVEAALGRHPGPGFEGVVVAVGADDPGLARRLPDGPRIVVPALVGRAPSPFARALLGTATVTVVIDPSELVGLAGEVRGPLVVTGVPRPELTSEAVGIDPGDSGDRLARAWATEFGPLPTTGPAVAWIAGPATVASAVEAWGRGAAVVTLPDAPHHAMMRRGGALVARSSLEALEATRLLHATRPLARALARRGRQEAMRLDPIEVVSGLFVEALMLAAEGA